MAQPVCHVFSYSIFNDGVHNSDYKAPSGRMTPNKNLERMWKKAVMAQSEGLTSHLPRLGKHEKSLPGWLVAGLRFEPL
jgi:hypothetical protein